MISKIKQISATISALAILGISMGSSVFAAYECPDTAEGVCPGSGDDINIVIVNVINILTWAVGAAAVLIIIIGGLMYILAAGNDQKVAQAKKMIIGACVGLAIAALSLVIISFVRGIF